MPNIRFNMISKENIPEILKPLYVGMNGIEATKFQLSKIGFEPGYAEIKVQYTDTYLKDGDEVATMKQANMTFNDVLSLEHLRKEKDDRISNWLPSGEYSKDGYNFLMQRAYGGSQIYVKPVLLEGGIQHHHFKGGYVAAYEIDDISLEDQLVKLAELIEKTGLRPCLVVYSGGKSLHVYYRFNRSLSHEELVYVKSYLCATQEADSAVTTLAQQMRLAGVVRLKDGETRHTEILFASDNEYGYSDFISRLNRIWKHKFPFSLERFVGYRSQQGINKKNPDQYKPPIDAFYRDTVNLEYAGRNLKSQPREVKGENKGSFPLARAYNEICEMLNRMPYQLAYPDAFHQWDSKARARGCSHFSATNNSKITLSVNPNDNQWFCFAAYIGGWCSEYHGLLQFEERTPKGKNFRPFVEYLAKIVGVDLEALIAKHTVSEMEIDAINEGLIEELDSTEEVEEVSPAEIFEPVEDFKRSGKTYDRNTIGICRENLADHFQHRFITSMNSRAVAKALEGFEGTVKLYFEYNDITSPVKLARMAQIYSLIKDKCKTVCLRNGYGENPKHLTEMDAKKMKWVKFEEIEAKYKSIKAAKEYRAQYADLCKMSLEPTLVFNEKYISDNIPELGKGVTLVSSPMGTGKTVYLTGEVDKYEGGNIYGYTYRNGLARQTSVKTGMILASDAEFQKKDLASLNRLSVCTNSAAKLKLDWMDGAMIVFDEIEAVFNHTLTSNTIEGKRSGIVDHVRNCILRSQWTDGTLLGLEARITDLTVEALEFIGIPREEIRYVKNEYKPVPWTVKLLMEKTGLYGYIRMALKAGKKLAIPTDSRAYAKQLEEMIKKEFPELKVLTLTKDNSSEEELKELMMTPNEYLLREQPDVFIYSPSLESGGDINIEYFDHVFGCFVCSPPRAIMQMLGRVRQPVPRTIYVKESDNSVYGKTDWRELEQRTLRELRLPNGDYSLGETIETFEDDCAENRIKTFASDENCEARRFVRLMAKFQARDNLGKLLMRSEVVRQMREDGHNVEMVDCEVDEQIKEEFKEAEEVIIERDTDEWYEADSEMSVAEAEAILSSDGHGKEKRLKAQKTMFLHNQPEIEITKGFVRKVIVENKGALRRKTKKLWYAMNKEVAVKDQHEAVHNESLKNLPSYKDIKFVGNMATLIEDLGFLPLLDHEGFTCDDDVIKAFFEKAKKKKNKVADRLRINVGKQEPVALIRSFANYFGLEIEQVKQRSDGKRVYRFAKGEVWEYQMQLIEAWDKKRDQKVAKKTAQSQLVLNFEGSHSRSIESTSNGVCDALEAAKTMKRNPRAEVRQKYMEPGTVVMLSRVAGEVIESQTFNQVRVKTLGLAHELKQVVFDMLKDEDRNRVWALCATPNT